MDLVLEGILEHMYCQTAEENLAVQEVFVAAIELIDSETRVSCLITDRFITKLLYE